MIDIFGVNNEIGGAWQLDGAVLTVEDGEDLVVTTAELQYARATNKFNPLNSSKKYLMTGESNGTASLGMIIGPSPTIARFISRYADACRVRENTLLISPVGTRFCQGAAQNRSNLKFKCTGVLLNNISVGVQQFGAGLTLVNAGLGFTFISLQILGGQGQTQVNANDLVANNGAQIQSI